MAPSGGASFSADGAVDAAADAAADLAASADTCWTEAAATRPSAIFWAVARESNLTGRVSGGKSLILPSCT